MNELAQKKCVACEGEVAPLNAEQIQNLLSQLSKEWTLLHNPDRLQYSLNFKNFYHTMAFVNALAYLAHQENHHPDLQIGYNRCEITWSTHAIEGLSLNDFICAAKTDTLIKT